MKKVILLLFIILSWSCSSNGSKRVLDDNSVNALSDSAEDTQEVKIKAGKIIFLRGEGDDYFGNERFIIDDYVEEIDSTLYYSIKKSNISAINTSERFKKSNGEYVVVQNNRNIVTLTDIYSSGEDKITYEYVGFLPAIQSYLFRFTSYEGYGNIIVSKENGDIISLRGKPFFSLDNKLFCTLRVDEEGETCGSIELFNGNLLGRKALYGLWSFQILPEEACWGGDNDLYIKGYSIVESQRYVRYYKLEISNSNYEIYQDSLIHKGYKIILKRNLSSKSQIFLIDNLKRETELIKPVYIDHEREVTNICNLFVLNGEKEDLIWIYGENADGGLPNCSMIYDLTGTLLAYTYSVRISVHDIQILDSKGNIDDILEKYSIKNMDDQINSGIAPVLNIKAW